MYEWGALDRRVGSGARCDFGSGRAWWREHAAEFPLSRRSWPQRATRTALRALDEPRMAE